MTEVIHGHQEQAGLPPGEHLTDSGYASADVLVSAYNRGITLIGPLLADTSRQARADGYTTGMFTLDWDAARATCPRAQPARPGAPAPSAAQT